MLRFLAVVAAGAVACSAFSAPTDLSSRMIKPDSIGYKHAVYNMATGKLEPVGGQVDRGLGPVVWSVTQNTGYFFGLDGCFAAVPTFDVLAMDWGDLPAGTQVGGVQLQYATDAPTDPNAVRMTFLFQDDANGFDDNTGAFPAGFFADLPGLPPGFPYTFVAWTITFDLEAGGQDFPLGNTDLDADGLADFGLYVGFLGAGYGAATATGPSMAGPNDPLAGPGAEDAFDYYLQDPNNPCVDPNAAFFYDATYWFGGGWTPACAPGACNPYAQWHLELYGAAGGGCPNPGCEQGDLDGDCVVGLADLSDLLENFGCCSPAACYDANADIDGSGCNDLGDLSALLEEFGLDCN
jgi:hypothetical protein